MAPEPSSVPDPPTGSPGAPRGLVSVVIPVRDARDDLAACLDALARQTVPPESLEILVVDDGSSDGTPEMAEARGATVLRRERGGAAAARNAGAAAARGDAVLFIDADCVPDARWAAALSAPLFADPGASATVGRYETRQSSPVARFIQLENELRDARMQAHGEIDFLNSGCCGFRREVLRANPFDESYPRLEDVELSFRLAEAGIGLRFVGDAWTLHRHPTRLSALMRRKFNYARYALRLYRKYPAKAATDKSTPQSRRWRLLTLALALFVLPLALVHPAFLGVAALGALGSMLFSLKTVRKAFAVSPGFGAIVPVYILLGNLAFLGGALRGVIAGRPPEANRPQAG